MYVITNGQQYLSREFGKHVLVSDINRAIKFPDQKSVSKNLIQMPRRWHKFNLRSKEIFEPKVEEKKTIDLGVDQKFVSDCVTAFLENNDISFVDRFEVLVDDCKRYASNVDSIRVRAEEIKNEAMASLSRLDQARNALLHKIENLVRDKKLNAVLGYRYCKELGDILVQRRKAKDALTYVTEILNKCMKGDLSFSAFTQKFSEYRANPVYHPHEIREIFEIKEI